MKIQIQQLGSAALYGTAGFCIFLMLLNRLLILMPDSKGKAPIILTTFVLIVGGGAVFGFFFHTLPWVLAPLALLFLILLGEVRRSFIRRSCAGTGPVNTTPHTMDIRNPITTTDLIVHRYELPCPKWNGTPLRIVQITDLHVHLNLPLEYYQKVIAVAEEAQPDIAIFTGDFISNLNALAKLRQVLRPIGRLETYAVLGNHDYWTNPDSVGAVIRESKIHLLSDESVSLQVGTQKLIVTGYDYPWGTKQKSISHQDNGILHIVLSHTPDNIYRLSESSADLVFSGHYHAGQIRVPMLGSIVVPSVYGRRFDHGHFVINDTHLFVASGIGAANPPVRIYCQPDIFVVDIVPQKKD